jgi:hypothetical protein
VTTVELEYAIQELEQQARTIAVLLVKRELDQLAVTNGDDRKSRSLDLSQVPGGPNGARPASKVCDRCGVAKGPSAFARGGRVCRACRAADNRVRQAHPRERRAAAPQAPETAEAEPPHPDDA